MDISVERGFVVLKAYGKTVEVPIQLIIRILDSKREDRLRVIQDFYGIQQVPMRTKTMVISADPAAFVLRSPDRGLIFQLFNLGDENSLMRICFNDLTRPEGLTFFAEESLFGTKTLVIDPPDEIRFYYEVAPSRTFFRDGFDLEQSENQIRFTNVNVEGHFQSGPCRIENYEEALEMYVQSGIKKLFDLFTSFRESLDKS